MSDKTLADWLPTSDIPANPKDPDLSAKGLTVPQLAKYLDKSIPTVRHYVSNLQPSGKKGRSHLYKLDDVQKVFEETITQTPKSAAKQHLESRKLVLQCQRLQIDIDERSG